MPFSEAIKEKVKIRADFTCCWCNDRKQKVEVHHIIQRRRMGQMMKIMLHPFVAIATLCTEGTLTLEKKSGPDVIIGIIYA